MIAITNDDGLLLELADGQNLLTEQAAPWLTDDELPGEFSYPIEAPLTESNIRFVGTGYLPHAALPTASLPVTAELNGVFYRRCSLSYRIEQGRLSCHLVLDASEVYEKTRQLKLRELFEQTLHLGDGTVVTNNIPAIVSLPARMKQIADMPPGQFPCTFFPVRNEGFFEEDLDASKVAEYQKRRYVNAWELLLPDLTLSIPAGWGFQTDSQWAARGYVVVPFFYLSYVLTQLMDRIGYRIESDWLAQDEIQRLVIYNMTAMAVEYRIQPLAGNYVTIGQHLPDLNVSDFLKAIKQRFGLCITYSSNDKICYITQFSHAYRSEAAVDLTPYQNGRYSVGEADGRGYSVEEFVDEGDLLYKDAKGDPLRPPPVITGAVSTGAVSTGAVSTGAAQQPVTLRVGTTQHSFELPFLSTTGRYLVPCVNQPGNILDDRYKNSDRYPDQKGTLRHSVGLRLLSYRGMTQDSQGRSYPLATPGVRDSNQAVIGMQALDLAGRYGAWRQYLRAYYRFRNLTRPVTIPLLLPISVLASLKLHQKISLTLEHQVLRHYLIRQLRAESPGQDGKAVVRLEALTLPTGLDEPSDDDLPLVWIQLVIVPLLNRQATGKTAQHIVRYNTVSIMVRVWADQAQTTPAVATNLALTIRLKRSWIPQPGYNPEKLYEEVLKTYVVNGNNVVIETELVTNRAVLYFRAGDTSLNYIENYAQTYQLDPGDDYTIL